MTQQPPVSNKGGKKIPYALQQQIYIPAAHAENHRRKWPGRGKLALGLLFMILFALAALIGLISATLLFFYSALIFPGATVADIPIGSMTTRQAMTLLADIVPQREVYLVHSSGAWPVEIEELGLVLDTEATVRAAYELGRTPESLSSITSGDLAVEPVWTWDLERTSAYLQRLAADVRVPAQNAQVMIQDGQATAVAAQDGLELDLDMTLNFVKENPTDIVRTGRLPLATRPLKAEVSDVGALAAEAQRLLSKQVVIRAYDPITDENGEWTIRPRDWQAWLNLVVSPGSADPFSWVVDEAAAQQYLASGWSWLGERRYLDAGIIVPDMIDVITSGRTGIDTRAYYQPQQHVVRPGESFSSIGYNYGIPYPWIQQANPGIHSLAVGDVVTIPSPDDMLPLPVVADKRVMVNLGQQRVQVYEDGSLIWDWPASTGINNSPTAPGVFQIQSHSEEAYASNWDLYMPYFLGIYRPVPSTDFMNGFHGFPTRDGNTLLWTDDLGYPVTYGCILLSSENAKLLYEWAEEGVVVEIQR